MTYIKKEKTIFQYTLKGELVATFDSINTASKATKVASCNISACCNDQRKQAGGFVWKREIK